MNELWIVVLPNVILAVLLWHVERVRRHREKKDDIMEGIYKELAEQLRREIDRQIIDDILRQQNE